MLPLIRSAQLEQDLIAIWRYVAIDNPAAATRLLEKIDRRIESLGRYPSLGNRQPEFGDKEYFVAISVFQSREESRRNLRLEGCIGSSFREKDKSRAARTGGIKACNKCAEIRLTIGVAMPREPKSSRGARGVH